MIRPFEGVIALFKLEYFIKKSLHVELFLHLKCDLLDILFKRMLGETMFFVSKIIFVILIKQDPHPLMLQC